MSAIDPKLLNLIQKEGWTIQGGKDGQEPLIEAFGQTFKLRHPVTIYLRLYRTETNPERKYFFMKAVHDYLWPGTLWHYWTERRFRKHCEGWNYICYAGGANTAKSWDIAKIAIIFWLANPRKRGVVVASTTLESLQTRVWGYVTKLLSKMAVKLPLAYTGGNAPKVLYPQDKGEGELKDTLHGIFAVAAKQGSDEKTISSWIGRHPEEALMMILDESTDMPGAIIKSFANLDSAGNWFQCVAIGNSNSVDDLHGAMATPEDGWENIDPMTMNEWRTTQKNGICLFFSCYESPAIFETDPVRKAALGRIFPTAERIEAKKKELGEDSDNFYRFVLGFWKSASTENTIVSKDFLEKYGAETRTEWGGIHPLYLVGGLDPAFSVGGDTCMLRFAVLGVDINGLYVLDFRDNEYTFVVPILRTSGDSADLQIGKYVSDKLLDLGVRLNELAIDCTGQGRAIGGVIHHQHKATLRTDSVPPPIRIYSTKTGLNAKDSFDVTIKSTYDLWYELREFVQNTQIRGLDEMTLFQLYSRHWSTTKGGKRVLESKAEYKKRIGAKYPSMAHSPDHADAAALVVQSAIMNYGFALGRKKVLPKAESFDHLQYIVHQYERKEIQEMMDKGAAGRHPTCTFRGSVRTGPLRPY